MAKPTPQSTSDEVQNLPRQPRRKSTRDKLRRKATFIGIDLAWSTRNFSGCAVIRNQRLVAHSGTLHTNQDILSFIHTHLKDESPAVIGIDAPLRVPNASGARLCDKALSADWRQFEAGALPANRNLFARFYAQPDRSETLAETEMRGRSNEEMSLEVNLMSPVRGEVLVALLSERLRFSESALIPLQTNDRLICEIYPHPAHVSLFGLEKTMKYKARSGRKYEQRWPEYERYQQHLRSLRYSIPKLKRTKALLTQTDVRQLRGKALKAYEDTLDAITCAYVVYYLWMKGPKYARTYGTLTDGHIIVPMTKAMEERL